MRVKDDMIVTVYKMPSDGFFPTIEGGFDLYIDANTVVAYCEPLQQLYVSLDGIKYTKARYVKDILYTESTEMSYKDYVQLYKDNLNDKYPDAPLIATIELDAAGRPKPQLPESLKPKDGFQKLRDAGLNFSIQR